MEPIRVLIAKAGLDGHDRGAKVVARALRDAGMEVIYTGLRQTPEMIVEAALQEDVAVVGLSILSGAHLTLFARVIDLLHQQGMDDVLVVGGGIIPDEDIPALQKMGVAGVFGPGTSLQEIVAFIEGQVAPSTPDVPSEWPGRRSGQAPSTPDVPSEWPGRRSGQAPSTSRPEPRTQRRRDGPREGA